MLIFLTFALLFQSGKSNQEATNQEATEEGEEVCEKKQAIEQNDNMAMWLWNDPFDCSYQRPSRLLDQHFGIDLEPEDFIAPLIPRELRSVIRCPAGYRRPWRTQASQQDAGSTIDFGKDKFTANLDVQQFRPEEISVKVTGDDTVTIEGKHEEKQDEHGYVSRHFIRKYVLPKGHDVNRLESKLSSDGVLTITAPKTDAGQLEEARSVPITHTGQAFKAVGQQKKKEEEKKK